MGGGVPLNLPFSRTDKTSTGGYGKKDIQGKRINLNKVMEMESKLMKTAVKNGLGTKYISVIYLGKYTANVG